VGDAVHLLSAVGLTMPAALWAPASLTVISTAEAAGGMGVGGQGNGLPTQAIHSRDALTVNRALSRRSRAPSV
jgi:hypothetical protein